MIDHPCEKEISELVDGFRRDGIEGSYRCLYCEAAFVDGMIYGVEGGNADAKMAASFHVARAHGGAFAALLARRTAGLPAVQEKVLQLLYEGKSDAEIAQSLGGKSTSTVRNHRFALRKREAESRTFLALMRLLGRKRPDTPRFIEYPAAMAAQDERAIVSEGEAKAVESRHVRALPEGGMALTGWPKKQKDKLVLLRRIAGLFQEGRRYTEKEVNAILAPVWPDHVTIRRYLIEYRFLDRETDCSEYWRL
jgi:DNA-binding CsgD family transcriptional regulator